LDFSINRSSPIPYYVQVKDTIQTRIQAGIWQPGDQLPGEPELCRMFGVSRTVIRQALNDLVNHGFLVREKGRGTFVAQPKIRESLVQKLTGFYQDMVEQGHTPRAQVLRQESIPASEKVAGYLQIDPGTPVIVIERLRFVQDVPIQLVTTYIPFSLCPALLNVDLSDQSLYAFLEQTCGVFIARGHRSIEAVPANEYEARLLRVQRGAPLILLDSVSFSSDGTAVEYYHALHRGDRTRFEVELIRVKEHGDQGEVLAPKYGNYPSGSGVILPPKKSDNK
jgi:GntR family transcriptional regulator